MDRCLPGERRAGILTSACDVEIARDRHAHWVKGTAAILAGILEQGDSLADRRSGRKLVEQQVGAERSDSAN
jgi:hypothetical protein